MPEIMIQSVELVCHCIRFLSITFETTPAPSSRRFFKVAIVVHRCAGRLWLFIVDSIRRPATGSERQDRSHGQYRIVRHFRFPAQVSKCNMHSSALKAEREKWRARRLTLPTKQTCYGNLG